MIKFAVVGYGNLGRACERIAAKSPDFNIIGIFTRRNPEEMSSPFNTPFYKQEDLEEFKDKIDVLALCTGSANDLTELGKRAAASFNTVDSFDTHAKMKQYALEMNKIASENGNLSFIGIGWDPGLFSLMRAVFDGVLPRGNTNTFWGRGVSQGHSEAVRRIEGVVNAVQYTIPKDEALSAARSGDAALTTRDKHLRECFVVAGEGADREYIEKTVKEMPDYFAEYDTVVHFISEDEFEKNHKGIPHGGFVLRNGESNGSRHNLEFSLKLESNPDFTAGVLMAYAKANAALYAQGLRGAKTVLDIPAAALLSGDWCELIQKYV